MKYFPILLIAYLVCSLILDYLSFCSKKTSIQFVNDMGFGYNLGSTFNCCKILEEDKNLKNEQIKLWGTELPTKKTISKIKKYGFKTIRFQVNYLNLTYESEKIFSEWISGLKKEVVDEIINYNMYCILSIHHSREFWMNEGEMAKSIYTDFWKKIANEFIDYDEHLAFESMNELDFIYFTLLDTTQAFVDTIRNSEGFNKERLLIISELSTEVELNNFYEYKLPIDPANKLAISLHYYFPSESLDKYDITPIDWYDNSGYPYRSIPIIR